MKYDFDLAVIGAGTAGLVASVVADSLGARVALIERERIGGECLWTGCVPSKTLIRAARVYDTIKRAAEFGVHVEKTRLIWPSVKLRIADVRDEIRRNERAELDKSGVKIVLGDARFQDAHTLRIAGKDGTRTLSATKFILATGSQARIPEIEGLRDVPFLTYPDIYTLPELPRSLLILGGGAIACEFGQALARFGCKITIVQSESRLLPREDEEISQACLKLLQNEGVTVHLKAQVTQIEADADGVMLHIEGESQALRGAKMLIAVGKTHDFSALNLQAASVKADEKGVQTDEFARTTAKHIWACGDATGRYLFTHYAEHSAKIAAQNALLPIKAKLESRAVPWTTFTDPEIARVGQTEAEAKDAGQNPRVFRASFADLDRAIIEGEASGFCKIITTQSGRILGAHIVGPQAGEIIHQFVPAIRDGALLQEMAEMIHVYPTLSEIAHRAGNEIYRETLESPLLQRVLKWWFKSARTD